MDSVGWFRSCVVYHVMLCCCWFPVHRECVIMLGGGFKAERLRVNLRLVINRLKLLEKKKSKSWASSLQHKSVSCFCSSPIMTVYLFPLTPIHKFKMKLSSLKRQGRRSQITCLRERMSGHGSAWSTLSERTIWWRPWRSWSFTATCCWLALASFSQWSEQLSPCHFYWTYRCTVYTDYRLCVGVSLSC